MKPKILMFITSTVFFAALTSATWLSAQHTHYKLISFGGAVERTLPYRQPS